MNHSFPAPKNVPAGFFRFSRWSDDLAETFPGWQAHFRAQGVRTVLVFAAGHVALFREGREAVSESAGYRRAQKPCQGPRLSK